MLSKTSALILTSLFHACTKYNLAVTWEVKSKLHYTGQSPTELTKWRLSFFLETLYSFYFIIQSTKYLKVHIEYGPARISTCPHGFKRVYSVQFYVLVEYQVFALKEKF